MIRDSLFTWDGDASTISPENKYIFENYLIKFSVLLLSKVSIDNTLSDEEISKAILDLTDSIEPQCFTYSNRMLKLNLNHLNMSVSKELFE